MFWLWKRLNKWAILQKYETRAHFVNVNDALTVSVRYDYAGNIDITVSELKNKERKLLVGIKMLESEGISFIDWRPEETIQASQLTHDSRSQEETQFTCDACGEKWNLVSHDQDEDRCPGCGKLVSINPNGSRSKEETQ